MMEEEKEANSLSHLASGGDGGVTSPPVRADARIIVGNFWYFLFFHFPVIPFVDSSFLSFSHSLSTVGSRIVRWESLCLFQGLHRD